MTTPRDGMIDDNICSRCRDLMGRSERPAESSSSTSCLVCLGLFGNDAADDLRRAIQTACEPYGGIGANHFSRQQPPSVGIAGDIALRYHLAGDMSSPPPAAFLRELKDHLKQAIADELGDKEAKHVDDDYPNFVTSEEQGFLCLHILITPVEVARPPAHLAPTQNKRKSRKRFRGHDPTDKQGGDPRANLEKRVRSKLGYEFLSESDVQNLMEQPMPSQQKDGLMAWFQSPAALVQRKAVDFHVAIWRKPFFVRGLYTKSRRDVSQSPFYVPSNDSDDDKPVVRKGFTSVEEEIAPVLADRACKGISTLNNDPESIDVVYGMVKFHASGREDMDVRMLLPPDKATNARGRPFVCQAIDALRMPSSDDLLDVWYAINHTTGDSHATASTNGELSGRVYGRNPHGVGIDCFTFAPASDFKNLQAETEEKVKHYGCLCWSKDAIPSKDELSRRLGRYPLQLQQRTPIRVLHRRTNTIRTRHVLTLTATMIDDHYFRLHLSTDAGTYVKEFVHGDLGRTVPSVSSLLGCKTDILELDCEGIQVST